VKRYSPADIKAIRIHLHSLLPREAFQADPTQLIPMGLHLVVVLACFAGIGRAPGTWPRAVLAIIAGHSLAVFSFYAHSLSHNVIVRRGRLRSVLEFAAWIITATPPTLWRKIHNLVHHRNTNTMQDAIRYYTAGERTWQRTVYSWLFIPSRYNWFNPLIFLTPMVLHVLHGNAAVTAPHRENRTLITNLGDYSDRERVWIVIESVVIVAWQVFVFYLSGGSWSTYLWAGLVTTAAGTMIAGTYVYSQHSLHAMSPHDDPFACTTLKLPRFIDRLHVYLGHHTAHHLLEGVRDDYLPQVTQLLREHYPDALDERGPIECWRAIYRNPMYKRDPAPDHAIEVTPGGVA
jgi:fatty acid desaturase